MARRLILVNLVLGVLVLSVQADLPTTGRPSDQGECEECMSKLTTQQRNKAMVLDLFREMFVHRNLDAMDKYVDAGPANYIEHSPLSLDGREAVKADFKKWMEQPFDLQVLRTAADEDLVFVHCKVVSKALQDIFGGRAFAITDIFRVDNGKIVEHWDTISIIPTSNDNIVSKHPFF